MQINSNTHIVNLTESQTKILMVNPNTLYNVQPRGNGKTFMIGSRIEHLSEVMPRCQILLGSDTYTRLHKRIVPNIISYFVNEVGMSDGVDFVKYKKPPEHWLKPIVPLDDFEHAISFPSGLALCLIALDTPGSGNAFNAQAFINDEAKYSDEGSVNAEVLPALRGADKIYGHLPEYGSSWFFTDKLGGNIQWILEKRKHINEPLIDVIIFKQQKIFQLQQEMDALSKKSSLRSTYNARIAKIEMDLNKIRRSLVYYCEGMPYENKDNLPKNYFRVLKRKLTKYEYEVSIENKDPDFAINSFYPALNPAVHFHSDMNDISEQQPLICSMDYQWKIIPMTVAQLGKLPGNDKVTLNIVDSLHTIHPAFFNADDESEISAIDQTIALFSKKYIKRINRNIYFVWDHTAKSKRPDVPSFAKTVIKSFKNNGWIVLPKYTGAAPEHNLKHDEMKTQMLANYIMFNKVRAYSVLRSIKLAGAIKSGNKTMKDKSKEKLLTNNPLDQTDYSDSFDMIAWACVLKMIPMNSEVFLGDCSFG